MPESDTGSPEPADTMREGIIKLFDTEKDADIQVKCQDTVFHVHKCIIACQEGFFERALKKGFREAKTGVIEITNTPPDVLKVVLGFLYGKHYQAPQSDQAAIFHAKVYSAGDFYQIPVLKKSARRRFKQIAYASSSPTEGAKQCFAAAEEVYSGTPSSDRGLRTILVDVTKKNLKVLIDHNEANKQVLKELPDFAVDLVVSKTRRANGTIGELVDVGLRCPKCSAQFGLELNDDEDPPSSITCPTCWGKRQYYVMKAEFDHHNK